MAKYDPLFSYFQQQSTQMEITIAFTTIADILQAPLPPSAFEYQAWWSNERLGSHVQARAWLDAGWEVDTVNLAEQWVKFVRA